MLKKIFWCLLGCVMLWAAGFGWFMIQVPTAKTEPPVTHGIVILTGGKGRLEYGLRLMTEGKAEKLFISGVGGFSNFRQLVDLLPMPLQADVNALPPLSIALGHAAENTIGNAEETSDWAKENEIKTLLVVTSNYHIPRALLELSQAMPDMTLIAAPVFPEGGYETRLLLSEYHKYLAGKFRHWLILRLPPA